ncbi:citrate synthase [Haloarcula vallismortis]|uniref:Citrate synthase II n=2 Tax=Haloarcula vallismortis TaxID=28442 RepID=M0JJH7_HALVA|nr:citrate synthase II [Haloarcula vallismortis ATCC 29715]SDW29292.1 citrate synthase [Haloarcula vallismortis]
MAAGHPNGKKVEGDRLIRPRARYVGKNPDETTFVPLEER